MVKSNKKMSKVPGADEALAKLIKGNQRFIRGRAKHPNQSAPNRKKLLEGQHPFAAVLCCSDSRVPPELLFDQGPGDLFVVRVAGNVLDVAVTGSIEYAVNHLEVPLVLVLGHSCCGAVTAALQQGREEGQIPSILEKIAPAVDAVKRKKGDLLDNAIIENIRRTVGALKACGPIISTASKNKKVQIYGACYNLESGQVDFII